MVARIVRALMATFDAPGPLGVAMISCYRDETDVRQFGFWDKESLPEILSWTRYVWEGVKGRLYMIGTLTPYIAGDLSDDNSQQRACNQFKLAVTTAVAEGAEVILFAAATKRLAEIRRPGDVLFKEELIRDFPGVTFTLGDNFTGLLLGRQILSAFELMSLPKTSRVLVIAPYGLLGNVAVQYLATAGANVIGLGNPKRMDLLEKMRDKFGIEICTSFEEVGPVDLVVACNTSEQVKLTKERVAFLQRPHRKLPVIDPCEPYNLAPDNLQQCEGSVIRMDGGNAFSQGLHYVLGSLSYKLLRLDRGITWGCFAETFILGLYPQLRSLNWMEITPSNIQVIEGFLGHKEGQFELTQPLCYNRKISEREFNLHLPRRKRFNITIWQKSHTVDRVKVTQGLLSGLLAVCFYGVVPRP